MEPHFATRELAVPSLESKHEGAWRPPRVTRGTVDLPVYAAHMKSYKLRHEAGIPALVIIYRRIPIRAGTSEDSK